MVGDNNTLECTTTSRQVPLLIQGHMFVTDLFHLPISGVDIVLGIQWLKQLGPITTNYQALPMSFFHSGQSITLIADVSLDPTSISTQQLKRCAQTQSISTLFSLTPLPTQLPHHTSTSHHYLLRLLPSSPNSHKYFTNQTNSHPPEPSNTIFTSSLTPTPST